MNYFFLETNLTYLDWFLFFFILFALPKKYAKTLDNKKLPPHKARSTARFIVSPTLAKI
jgi:hypothetical protein